MTSKKKRKKLKQQYTTTPIHQPKFHNLNKLKEDQQNILSYLKKKPNTVINRTELIKNLNLNYYNRNEITQTIKHIKQNYNVKITSKQGYNGGYIYHE